MAAVSLRLLVGTRHSQPAVYNHSNDCVLLTRHDLDNILYVTMTTSEWTPVYCIILLYTDVYCIFD